LTWRKYNLLFQVASLFFANDASYSLIYPQSVTLYQVDDQLYEPEEVATTNLFNTFLDALDGVSYMVLDIKCNLLICPVLLHVQRLW
jgi:hypothetical protein